MAEGYDAASCSPSHSSLGGCTGWDGVVMVATHRFTFSGSGEKGIWCVAARGRTLRRRNMLVESPGKCLHVNAIISPGHCVTRTYDVVDKGLLSELTY